MKDRSDNPSHHERTNALTAELDLAPSKNNIHFVLSLAHHLWLCCNARLQSEATNEWRDSGAAPGVTPNHLLLMAAEQKRQQEEQTGSLPH